MFRRVSFVRFNVSAWRTLVVLLASMASMALAGVPARAADSRTVALRPSPAATAAPSGAELVGKLLAERAAASDPDVPLPQRNLTAEEPAFVPLTGPRIYGHRDEGSLVLGLKIPIPADRRAAQ
jgi:hypothetical protein